MCPSPSIRVDEWSSIWCDLFFCFKAAWGSMVEVFVVVLLEARGLVLSIYKKDSKF